MTLIYYPNRNSYAFTSIEKKLICMLLGIGLSWATEIAFDRLLELLKQTRNRRARRALEKQFNSKKDNHNLVLICMVAFGLTITTVPFTIKKKKNQRKRRISTENKIRGGSIDVEDQFEKRIEEFAISILQKYNRVQQKKFQTLDCVAIQDSGVLLVNNEMLVKRILKTLGLKLTKNDIVSITPALFSVIVLNSQFYGVMLENMNYSVRSRVKTLISLNHGQIIHDIAKNYITNFGWGDIRTIGTTAGCSFTFKKIVEQLIKFFNFIGLITNERASKLKNTLLPSWYINLSITIGVVLAQNVFAPFETCYETLLPLRTEIIRVHSKDQTMFQRIYSIPPHALVNMKDLDHLPQVYISSSEKIILDNKRFSKAEVELMLKDWKDPNLFMDDFPRIIKSTKTLNLDYLRTGDDKVDTQTYKSFIDSEQKIPLLKSEEVLIKEMKSKRIGSLLKNKRISSPKPYRKFNKKIHTFNDFKEKKCFMSEEIIDVKFEDITPKISEKTKSK